MRPNLRLLLNSIVFALIAQTAAASAQAFDPCLFKPSELQAAFGVPFTDGKRDRPIAAGPVTLHACRYEARNFSLRVGADVYGTPEAAKQELHALAGKLVPIPNDPDGAHFQEGQGDLTDPALHYTRGKVAIHLRLMGIYYDSPAEKAQATERMRQKLAALRRVP
ncbi:MAG: hypothetical protein ACK4XK_06575 [Casimicrobiaceae bacterium]